MKLAFRINLLFTIIVSCILGGMTLLILNLTRQNVQQDFHDRLTNRAARTAYLFALFKNDTTYLLQALNANTPPLLFNKNIIIYDTSFRILYEFHDENTTQLRADRNWLEQALTEGEFNANEGQKEVYILKRELNEENILVMVAAENIAGKIFIADLKKVFVLYFPMAVLITLVVGYLFSRTVIRPVKNTIQDVNLITTQNLSHRLFVGNRKDELAQLNKTFNDLLDRLEESFAIEKRFIANASHELSTPLTSISSQIQVALLQERSPEEYKKILDSVLKDAQGLHQLTRNLLEIAQTGTQGSISLEKLRIDEILIRAHSEVLRQNPGYNIELSFPELPDEEEECYVFGNAHLLTSAIRNLLENGCKYSPDNTSRVQLNFKGREVEVLISNKSEYIPDEEIDKLFESFYRSSNALNKPGVGLGLSLTKRIIGLHKGNLGFISNSGSGTVVSLTLPTLKKEF